jgi:Zn-dependent protease with chaperone function
MDFFARQDRARHTTTLLLIYFAGAVLSILAALNLLALTLVSISSRNAAVVATVRDVRNPDMTQHPAAPDGFWQPGIVILVTMVTIFVIGMGSLYKIIRLSGGGKSVAELMRAIPIPPSPGDPKQRVLRNVVEEMAIASGVAVPRIYLLPKENHINAFAAGFTPKDAVICVTQGCIDRLTREELQGVIAHEFSHICNGDMRLDLRLVGILHGILLLGLIGYGMLRVGSSVRSSNDKGAGILLGMLAIGCVVAAIGFIGLFFGRLIQAAVCRQREFLADAAAVQFTRNPGAMSDALKKLGASGSGSRIGDHTAEQIAHMFFASSMGIEWGMFATHPPLAARIKAIDPNWDGKYPAREGPSTLERYGGGGAFRPEPGMPAMPIPIAAAAIVGTLGMPQLHHIAWASDFLTSIPPVIDQAAREPFSARALVFSLLLSDDPAIREKQQAAIRTWANPITLEATVKLAPAVAALGSRARRILLDLTLPALRLMSDPQADQFRRVVKELVDADKEISVFEFMLYKILARQLPPPGRNTSPPPAAYFALKPLLPDLQVVLSALAAADGKDSAAVEAAFRAGITRLDDPSSLTLQTPVGLPALDAALDRLALAAPGVKRRVVDACAYCVAADGIVQTEEGEMLRAVTSTLDCPLPPLLAENVSVPQPA